MKCWICGDEGNTGEHLLKVSDIKDIFTNISQQSPILYHDDNKKNVLVGSPKSNRFKSDAKICAYCNNSRTQPHDESWRTLSTYLRSLPLHRRGPLKTRLNRAFKQNIFYHSVCIQLYFTKLFGCRIAADQLPIDLKPFAHAIMTNTPVDCLFLVFKKAMPNNIRALSITHIQTIQEDTDVDIAGWVYSVGELNVEVMYTKKPERVRAVEGSFHPLYRNRYIRFIDYEEK